MAQRDSACGQRSDRDGIKITKSVAAIRTALEQVDELAPYDQVPCLVFAPKYGLTAAKERAAMAARMRETLWEEKPCTHVSRQWNTGRDNAGTGLSNGRKKRRWKSPFPELRGLDITILVKPDWHRA